MSRRALALASTALLAGIAAGDAAPALSVPGILCAPLCGLLALLPRRRSRALAALAAGAFLAGAALPARWTAAPAPDDLARILCDAPDGCGSPADAVVEGVLAGRPAAVPGGARLRIDVREITLAAGRRAASGRVRVYLTGDPSDLGPGDRLRFRARLREPGRYRNPGCPDRPRALARRGVRRVTSIDVPEALARLASPGENARGGPLEGARRALRALLRREGGAGAPVLEALLLGDRGNIPGPVRDAYARAGVAHVLAVSGLHVALVALGAGGALRALLRRRAKLAAGGGAAAAGLLGGIAAAWGYALLAGAGEPALRAALMGTALAGGALLLRRGDPWHAFWLAAACLAIGDPARLFEPGVQLSFAAVGGLLWCWRWRAAGPGSAPGGAGWRRAGRWARATVLATLVATLATLPIQAAVFGRISLVAPVANLIVLPLLGGLALPLLLLAAALSPVCAWAAAPLVRAAAAAAVAATGAARAFASAPLAALALPPATLLEAAAYYALVLPVPVILPEGRRASRTRRRALILLGAGAIALAADAALHARRLRPPPALRVRVLDVGQGDAALLETPAGARMLVDAGPAFALPGGARFDAGERVVGRTLRARWIRRLDVLAVSHPDADHAGGARAVVEAFDVGEIWLPAVAAAADGFAPLVAAAARRGAPVRALARGDRLRLGEGVIVEVLWPPPPPPGPAPPVAPAGGWNDRSLVLRVRGPGLRVLLPGDLEASGERDLLRAGTDLRAEVLKAPHHGSDTSAHAAFLAAVRPRVVLISAGAWNRFGFPGADALARLEASGARVFRTDRQGAVTVTGAHGCPGGADSRHSGGAGISVQWQRPIGRKGGRTGTLFDCPRAGTERGGGKSTRRRKPHGRLGSQDFRPRGGTRGDARGGFRQGGPRARGVHR